MKFVPRLAATHHSSHILTSVCPGFCGLEGDNAMAVALARNIASRPLGSPRNGGFLREHSLRPGGWPLLRLGGSAMGRLASHAEWIDSHSKKGRSPSNSTNPCVSTIRPRPLDLCQRQMPTIRSQYHSEGPVRLRDFVLGITRPTPENGTLMSEIDQ